MSRSIDQASEGERDKVDKVTNMENEIEKKFLIDKLNELIIEIEKSDKPIPSQIFQLPSKFNKLKTIIEQELNKTTPSSSNKLTKEQLYNLNNLLSEWHSKQKKPFSVESLKFAPICALALEGILEDVQKKKRTLEEGSHGDTSRPEHGSVPLPQTTTSEGETRQDDVVEIYRWSNQYVDEKSVFGTKDKEVFLRRLILPQPPEEHNDSVVFRGFGLVGMRGIGKTTLAQMVFNHPDIRSHFLPRVWVCVSKQPGDDPEPKKEIVKRALRSLGVEDGIIDEADTHQVKGLLYALRQQLLGKRYLIVFDDVCIEEGEYLDFVSSLEKNIEKCDEKMAYGLPKECGGAVIVTSRNKEIAKRIVGEDNLHRVLPLSGENCWEIFKNTVKEEGDSVLNDMEKLEKKITEKCHGLPLAAKMMGEIARKPNTTPPTTN